jgi:hypothetical protein
MDETRYERFRGTFAPFLRASDRPMAMACFRLFTLGWRPLPDFKVPFLARLMALDTAFFAPLPYRRFELFVRLVGMSSPRVET